jgi:hypothetical protein
MMSLLVIEMMKVNFILKSHDFPISALISWIPPVCLSIHYLQIKFPKLPNGFHNEIVCLKNMKKLAVSAVEASDLKEVTLILLIITTTLLISSQIVRRCRQVETLCMNVTYLILRDLAELEPAENVTDITLNWDKGPSMKEVLPVLKRWRHLGRLKLEGLYCTELSDLPFEVLSDFIMEMKRLSYLHIAPEYGHGGQLEILRDKVNEFILPRRPNFKFVITDDISDD